jgi:F-type H+-transporting ATPase subunit b
LLLFLLLALREVEMNHSLISNASSSRSSIWMRLTAFALFLVFGFSSIAGLSAKAVARAEEETKKVEEKAAVKESGDGHAASTEKKADDHGEVAKSEGHDAQGHGAQGHGAQGHGAQGHGAQGHGAQGHGGSGHHDDMDLTHANAAADMELPNSIRSDKTLFSLVVFGLLLVGLYLLAWKPITEGLGKREADINGLIAKTQKASEDAADKLKQYELQLQTAAQEAQNVIAQARRDGEASAQRIIAEAQNEAIRRKDQAIAEIDSAKRAAISELSNKSTDLAFSLAKRIVGRELRKEDHQQLIQDVLNQLPSKN